MSCRSRCGICDCRVVMREDLADSFVPTVSSANHRLPSRSNGTSPLVIGDVQIDLRDQVIDTVVAHDLLVLLEQLENLVCALMDHEATTGRDTKGARRNLVSARRPDALLAHDAEVDLRCADRLDEFRPYDFATGDGASEYLVRLRHLVPLLAPDSDTKGRMSSNDFCQ